MGGRKTAILPAAMALPELLMVLLSALLHASWSAAIKGTRSPLAFNMVQTAAMTLVALCVLPFIELAEVPTDSWLLVGAAGVVHGLYLWFLSASLERADLSLAYPIIRSTPAFLPFVAVPLLGDSLTPMGVAGIAIVVLGIWLVHGRGGWRAVARMPGVGFAWLTLAATVGYALTDKAGVAGLAGWDGPLPASLVWYALLSLALPFVFFPIAWRNVDREELRHSIRNDGLRVIGAVIIGVIGYGLILEAYRTAPASYVVAVRQLSVLFAVGIAVFFLGEKPGGRRVAGAAATVAGVALIAWGG
jgi:drug/metabolite transporter (DMT)-like permease